MSASMGVILFNKWILAYSGFHFPVTLTLWHMLLCSSIAFLLVRVFKVIPDEIMTSAYCLQCIGSNIVTYAYSRKVNVT